MTSRELTEAFEREERAAWDTYAVAAVSLTIDASVAAMLADWLLAERRKRFGLPPPPDKRPLPPMTEPPPDGMYLGRSDGGGPW